LVDGGEANDRRPSLANRRCEDLSKEVSPETEKNLSLALIIVNALHITTSALLNRNVESVYNHLLNRKFN
jgi:hypothetical protein